jgi:hypothetical protein
MNFAGGAQIVGDQISYRGTYFKNNYCHFLVPTCKNVYHFTYTSSYRQVTVMVQVGPHVGLLVVSVSGALNLEELVDFWEGCALPKLSLHIP